jgi:O-antigen/teichoic acid export membrane protein
MVVGLLSAQANAAFYIAWSVALNVAMVVPLQITTALFAVGAADRARLGLRVRLTMRISIGAGALAAAILIVGAGPILTVFGHAYAHDAASSLRILSLGFLPLTVRSHFIALARIDNRVARVMPVVLIGTVAELALPAFGSHWGGLEGLSVGWVSAVALEAVVMGPTVYRMIRCASDEALVS